MSVRIGNTTLHVVADDHVRGEAAATVTVLAYGDYECPHTRALELALARLRRLDAGAFRSVFRHFPLRDVHPHAQSAAEAAEAVYSLAGNDAFWIMHDGLFAHQDDLDAAGLERRGAEAGVDPIALRALLATHPAVDRIERDIQSGRANGAKGTPTVFINGERYLGARDVPSLRDAIAAAVPGKAPPRWLVRLTAEFDAADARATALVTRLSTAQLNWKPRPDVWSVGQCVEHLCLSNEVYVAPLSEALRGQPAGYADEITPGWLGRWFIRTYIEPATQKKRARSPRKSAPVAQLVDPSILDRFIASNAAMRALMSRAQELDVNRIRFKNPYVPLIRFTVGTGFQIIARHNHRHLLQAERITLQAPAEQIPLHQRQVE